MRNYLAVLRTLIVDDSEDQCALFRLQLGRLSWIELVGCVHDGLDALQYLRQAHSRNQCTAAARPDLMLLDLNMPRCTGIEVLKCLHHQPERPRVVLWSDALRPRDTALALDLGADVVCAKPNSFSELEDILQQVALKIHSQHWVPLQQPYASYEHALSTSL